MLKLGLLISGRGSNMLAIIEEVEKGNIPAEIGCVISDKMDAEGIIKAKEHNIDAFFLDPKDLLREDYDKLIVQELKKRGARLILLAGFRRIISPYFVEEYRNRIMNIHPSLLPAFPGLHAQRQALEYGVKTTGATVHFVDYGLDTGPIILQKPVPVLDGDTEESLSERILKEEHKIYPFAVKLYVEGRLKVIGRRVKIL